MQIEELYRLCIEEVDAQPPVLMWAEIGLVLTPAQREKARRQRELKISRTSQKEV